MQETGVAGRDHVCEGHVFYVGLFRSFSLVEHLDKSRASWGGLRLSVAVRLVDGGDDDDDG